MHRTLYKNDTHPLRADVAVLGERAAALIELDDVPIPEPHARERAAHLLFALDELLVRLVLDHDTGRLNQVRLEDTDRDDP